MKVMISIVTFAVLVFGLMATAQESKVRVQKLPPKRTLSEENSNREALAPVEASTRARINNQALKKENFKGITPQVGLVFSDLFGGDADLQGVELKGTTGLSVGTTVDIEVSKKFPILVETGLFYKQMGAEIDGPVSGDVKLNYLTIPGYLKAAKELNATTKGYVKGGLLANLLVSEEIKVSNGEQSVDLTSETDFRKFDLGPSIGAGLKLKSKGQSSYEFNIDANYYVGLLKTFDLQGMDDVYNHALTLNLGVNFPM